MSHVIPNTTPRVFVRRSTRATSRPQNYFSTEEANLTWAEALLLGDEKPEWQKVRDRELQNLTDYKVFEWGRYTVPCQKSTW